jgi:hypothetical protein
MPDPGSKRILTRLASSLGPVVLKLHTEPVGHAVDVVVVGDHLVGVDDRSVVAPGGS